MNKCTNLTARYRDGYAARVSSSVLAVLVFASVPGNTAADEVVIASWLQDRPARTQLWFDPTDRALPTSVRFGPDQGSETSLSGYSPVDWLEVSGCGGRSWHADGAALARLPPGALWLARVGSPAGRSGRCRPEQLRLWFWITSYPGQGDQSLQVLWQVSFDRAGRAQVAEIGGRDEGLALLQDAGAAPLPRWRSGKPVRMQRWSTWRPQTFPSLLELSFETVAMPGGGSTYRPYRLAATGCAGPPLVLDRPAFAAVRGDFYWTEILATSGRGRCHTGNMRILFMQSVRLETGPVRGVQWEARTDIGARATLQGPDAELPDPLTE